VTLLSSHIQVHNGLLTAVGELLLVAERPFTVDELRHYLQPPRLGEDVPDVIRKTVEAGTWLGLWQLEDDKVAPTTELTNIRSQDLYYELPRLIRQAFGQMHDVGAIGEADEKGRDLPRALAWFLAQDSWNPPLAFERVPDSGEERQRAQFPDGPEFVNNTKWPHLMRWATFLGLVTPDPVRASCFVPDPTYALHQELSATEEQEWTARGFIDFLATRCAALDHGSVRQEAMRQLASSELPWEHDQKEVSPSLSLALLRLQHEKRLVLERRADAPETERCTIRDQGEEVIVDKIRLLVEPSNV
jgi:hypothetical protein